MQESIKDNPGLIAPPPLIYAGALVLSLLLHERLPLPVLPRKSRRVPAVVLLGSALGLGLFAARNMRRAGTNINPQQPTTALVIEGPYRFTRNPIYLSLTLLYTGIALLANTLWAILLLPGVLILMQRGVIEREEAYLEHKFGRPYVAYKEKVRRWV